MKKLMILMLVSLGLMGTSIADANAATASIVMPNGQVYTTEVSDGVTDGLTQDIIYERVSTYYGTSSDNGWGILKVNIYDDFGPRSYDVPYSPGSTLQDVINLLYFLGIL